MRPLTRQRLGVLLILLGIVAVVGSFAVSAATAPDAVTDATNDTTERGRTLVGMQAAGQIAMFDASGDVLWRFGNGSADYFDVTMLNNGTVLAGYIAGDQQSCGQFASPCARTGFRLIEPQPTPHIVREWSFPVRSKLNSEVHDVNRLPSGSYLLTDMEYERIMIVAPNGTITWQWNASQFYDAPPDPTTTDWLHINDVDRIGSGRYMVSVRNANQLLVIERGTGVVDVINEDENGSSDESCRLDGDLADYNNNSNGDIRCGDPSVIDHQHNPQYLGPGAVLVADSENDRVVELHEKNGEWQVAWGVDSANGVQFNWPRDADRLPNGHTLITDSRNNRVVEVTPNGTAVWGVKTGTWPYDADRLPYGELLGGDRVDRMNATGDPSVRADGSVVPLLGRAYSGLSYVVSLPLWFQPWHIGITVAAVVLVVLGGVLVWSGRRNR
jgi:hypothetical protein